MLPLESSQRLTVYAPTGSVQEQHWVDGDDNLSLVFRYRWSPTTIVKTYGGSSRSDGRTTHCTYRPALVMYRAVDTWRTTASCQEDPDVRTTERYTRLADDTLTFEDRQVRCTRLRKDATYSAPESTSTETRWFCPTIGLVGRIESVTPQAKTIVELSSTSPARL